MKRKNKAVTVAIAVLSLILMCCGTEEGQVMPEIEGITSYNIEVVYDGNGHGITVENLKDGDTVYYEVNGGWVENCPKYTVPGEYEIKYRVERDGYEPYESSATIKITTAIIQGITANNVEYIYDGKEHNIEINGTETNDVITYSYDGQVFTEAWSASEVGRYVIYYRVERIGEEYSSSAVMEILPVIQGIYVNVESGVITVTEKTIIVNGKEQTMKYGCDGKGETEMGKEFEASDGILTYDGNEYEIAEGNIYKITVGEQTSYAVGREIRVEFEDGKGLIKTDGKTVMTVADKNYAESSNCEIQRELLTNDVGIKTEPTQTVTEVVLELSERPTQEKIEYKQIIIYDGEEHTPNIDGEVKYINGEIPKYTEVGRYMDRAVRYEEGYLPQIIEVITEIAPNLTGIYYTDSAVMEITNDTARINGTQARMNYSDGKWYIDGTEAEVNGNTIVIDGKEYIKTDGQKLAVIVYDGNTTVVEVPDNNIEIFTDGDAIEIYCYDDLLYCADRLAGEIHVYLNGEACIDLGGQFIIGKSEIEGFPVLFINISVGV